MILARPKHELLLGKTSGCSTFGKLSTKMMHYVRIIIATFSKPSPWNLKPVMKLGNISAASMPGDKLTRMSVLLAPAETPGIPIAGPLKAFPITSVINTKSTWIAGGWKTI